MKKFTKFVTGAVLAAALFMSSIPAQAQSSLNYVSRQAFHITTNTTNTPSSSDAYLVSLVISVSSAGSAWVISVKNKEGTAKILYSATAAVGTTTISLGPKESAIYMKSGIDIITTGTTPGVADAWVTFYKP